MRLYDRHDWDIFPDANLLSYWESVDDLECAPLPKGYYR
jgi:hypothetical protein